MEGVEEANRAAVGSCKKLMARLARSGDPYRPTAAGAETDAAVARFGRVVTILSNRVGHARARVGGKRRSSSSSSPVDPSFLLDHPLVPCGGGGLHGGSTPAAPRPPPEARGAAPPGSHEKETSAPMAVAVAPCAAGKSVPPAAKADRSMFLETPFLDLNGGGSAAANPSAMVAAQSGPKAAVPPAANHPSCATQIQFQQKKKMTNKSLQFDRNPGEKFHIEMAPRSVAREPEVITFSFDNSVCTSSAATTSFFTSISSQLIGMSDAATNPAAAAATSKKAHCARKADDADDKCHCPKKKKPREKRVVRMPAVSDKVADIPADNYSWRKYGQKPIKGSPHPRGYYRCSSMRDCPARKHVERCRSEPGFLVVTYENDHSHAPPLDLSALAASSEA